MKRQRLRRILRHYVRDPYSEESFRAWKIIDSGAAGNSPVFLLYRFRDVLLLARAGRLTGLDVVDPFWKNVLRRFALVLTWARAGFLAVFIIALVFNIIKLF